MNLYRATLFHTPRNPFHSSDALEVFGDGGLLVDNGRIVALGQYNQVSRQYPHASTHDLRGGVLLPGLIDTHIHYPQVRVLGGLGMPLLEWLERNTLPEEARFGNPSYARQIAKEFLHGLASHGTTTALVFGCHFASGQAELFAEAEQKGLRIASGMVLSDRMLRDELHQTPEQAYQGSSELIRRFHARGRLLYAITPRFSLSASEAILEVCQTLQSEHTGLRFTSHINENDQEVETVKRLFAATDYLETYERFGLVNRHSVLAHNLHPSDSELIRMAAAKASASHCPCSNSALGSGFFPMHRHLQAGVHFALGTDVGGGTGFGMLKESLQACFMQNLMADGEPLQAAHLLYLATLAGAEALDLHSEVGSLEPTKAADLLYLRPPKGSALEAIIAHAEDPLRILSALFTSAGAESVAQVWVEGQTVYRQESLFEL